MRPHEAETIADLVRRSHANGKKVVWVCLACGARHHASETSPDTCALCGEASFWAQFEHSEEE